MRSQFIFLLFFSLSAQARTFKKMDLPEPIQGSMNRVLKSGDDLHLACVSRRSDQVDKALDQVNQTLTQARQESGTLGPQKTHVDRILNAAQTAATKARKASGEERTSAIKQLFTEIVQIEQIFRVDHYNIFFCPKDQSVWIQKDKKPLNPVHPFDNKSCGKMVQ